jgi:hypothetical protein
MVPPPALIWKFYEAADENGQRKCTYCDKTETTSSNAEKHTKRNHSEEFKKFETKKENPPSRKRKSEPVQSSGLKN